MTDRHHIAEYSPDRFQAKKLLEEADLDVNWYEQVSSDKTQQELSVYETEQGRYEFELRITSDGPFTDAFLDEIGDQQFSGELPYSLEELDDRFYSPE